MKQLSNLFILFGIVLLAFSVWQYIEQKGQTQAAMGQAEKILMAEKEKTASVQQRNPSGVADTEKDITPATVSDEAVKKQGGDLLSKSFSTEKETSSDSSVMEETHEAEPKTEESGDRPEFQENEVIGMLEIPALDYRLPIIEGTAPEMLAKGVGHYKATVFPGEGDQILLAGHRDTVFRNFGELKVGDRFIVHMPYGSFTYEFARSEIVDADDRSVIRKKGKEELVLSTCYPFNFIGSAPERYIIYAYPIE